VGTPNSNAIGQVELCCTPAGLSIGLFGVGPYAEGYAVGALVSGTHFIIPYHRITTARAYGDQLQLDFDLDHFPHDRLTLRRFVAGPGVPVEELRRRRLILHLGVLGLAALASLAAAFLGSMLGNASAGWSALGYGAIVAATIVGLGYAVDQSFFTNPPAEATTRAAFIDEMSLHVPGLVRTDAPYPAEEKRRPLDVTAWLPKTSALTGVALGALLLTGLVTGQRLLIDDRGAAGPSAQLASPRPVAPPVLPETPAPTTPPSSPRPADNALPLDPTSAPSRPVASAPGADIARVERRCMCDRADSALWKSPIPRLSALLIERRAVPTRTHLRTHVQIAIVNNSDTPLNELTVHVQFLETRGGKARPTKERPLYFEGPLAPGHAVKWSTEARGDSYELLVPDLGQLGPNGDGAASAQAFVDLLRANNRPVRLHAARMLSYLGDARARDAALELKDALRAAEAPYLRRILMATGDVRVCDTEVADQTSTTLGACVYNATETDQKDVGLALHTLSRSLDVQQPLADPPELLASSKWKIDQPIAAQSGVFVRVTPPAEAFNVPGSAVELFADEFDMLE
jgi:hypothetical protein